jgi:hypothetical protein
MEEYSVGTILFNGIGLDLGCESKATFKTLIDDLDTFSLKNKENLHEMFTEVTMIAKVLSVTQLSMPNGQMSDNRKEIRKVLHFIVGRKCEIIEQGRMVMYADCNLDGIDVDREIDGVIDKFIKYTYAVVDYHKIVEPDDKHGILFTMVPGKFDKKIFKRYFKKRCCNYACTGDAKFVCVKCKLERYCSKECQIIHWKKEHKKVCCSAGLIVKDHLELNEKVRNFLDRIPKRFMNTFA